MDEYPPDPSEEENAASYAGLKDSPRNLGLTELGLPRSVYAWPPGFDPSSVTADVHAAQLNDYNSSRPPEPLGSLISPRAWLDGVQPSTYSAYATELATHAHTRENNHDTAIEANKEAIPGNESTSLNASHEKAYQVLSNDQKTSEYYKDLSGAYEKAAGAILTARAAMETHAVEGETFARAAEVNQKYWSANHMRQETRATIRRLGTELATELDTLFNNVTEPTYHHTTSGE